jgi:hypothetical protein
MLFDFMKTREGTIAVSVILGLGLAAMFRQVCSKGNCIVIKGPNTAEVEKNVYKIKGDCFKYTPHVVKCKSTPSHDE